MLMELVISMAEGVFTACNTRNPLIIAEQLDINVLEMNFKKVFGISGGCEGERFIGVEATLYPEEIKQIVIAHELGHLILHPKENFLFVKENTFMYGKLEYQANLFAMALCYGEHCARELIFDGVLSGGNIIDLYNANLPILKNAWPSM